MRTFLTAATTALLVLSACSSGSGDTGTLREDLETQAQAQNALRTRVGELEQRLDATGESGQQARDELVSSLEEKLTGLEEQLAAVRTDLDAAKTASEDADAEHTAALSDLEQRIGQLESTAAELRQLILELRDDLNLLERRFENHTH